MIPKFICTASSYLAVQCYWSAWVDGLYLSPSRDLLEREESKDSLDPLASRWVHLYTLYQTACYGSTQLWNTLSPVHILVCLWLHHKTWPIVSCCCLGSAWTWRTPRREWQARWPGESSHSPHFLHVTYKWVEIHCIVLHILSPPSRELVELKNTDMTDLTWSLVFALVI